MIPTAHTLDLLPIAWPHHRTRPCTGHGPIAISPIASVLWLDNQSWPRTHCPRSRRNTRTNPGSTLCTTSTSDVRCAMMTTICEHAMRAREHASMASMRGIEKLASLEGGVCAAEIGTCRVH